MSSPLWQNLPVPTGVGDPYAVFSADPRQPSNARLRASDADRAAADAIVRKAYAEGRLDADEFDQRIAQVSTSKQLGELATAVSDVVVVPGAAAAPAPASAHSGVRSVLSQVPRWWVSMTVLLNLIWLMTCLTSGELIYYWPMWPMFGTLIPAIMSTVNGGQRSGRNRSRDRGQVPPDQPPPGPDGLR